MQMQGFGSYLKEAREARKISLAQISKATKIRRAILEDIERDHAEFLLPEVVVKSFIEAYARYVGLDPEEALARYAQWRKGSVTPEQGKPLSDKKQAIPTRYILAGIMGLISIIIVSFLVFTSRGPQEGAQEEARAKAPSGQKRMVPPIDQRSTPARPSVTERAPLYPPAADTLGEEEESIPSGEHTLVIKASERTWIQIQEGSSLPLDVILGPGDSYSRRSSHPLSIVIGNARGVSVTFDGKGVGIAGEGGEVVRLKLPSPEAG
jgi:cytoskeletal protein RodZ